MSTATAEGPSMGLIKSPENGNGHLSVFDAPAQAMPFITEMGKAFWKSQVGGVKTEAEGQVMAFACLAKRTDPFSINERYHLMDGKLSMRAERMLAEFNQAGGRHKWVKTGEDGVEASLWLKHPNGDELTTSFSFAEAKDARYVRDGSNWSKGPKAIGQMLRARCTSNGIRMLMPGVVAGCYTPEELEDSRIINTTAERVPSVVEVEARRKELQAMAQQSETATNGTVPHTEETVVDAVVEPVTKTEQAAEQPPFEVPDRPTPEHAKLTTILLEIDFVAGQIGMTRAGLEEKLKTANPGFAGLESLEIPAAEKLLENLRAKVSQTQPK